MKRLRDGGSDKRPPVNMPCGVTVTEGVKNGTYGGCQCGSSRQTDRRPQRAPGARRRQNPETRLLWSSASKPHSHAHTRLIHVAVDKVQPVYRDRFRQAMQRRE